MKFRRFNYYHELFYKGNSKHFLCVKHFHFICFVVSIRPLAHYVETVNLDWGQVDNFKSTAEQKMNENYIVYKHLCSK